MCKIINMRFWKWLVSKNKSADRDEEPSPLPSIINKLPVVLAEPSNLHAALVIQQQGSSVSEIEQEKITPKPSTSAQLTPPLINRFENVASSSPPRKTNRERKTRKFTIYTDTPEKEEIRKEHENRLQWTKAKQVKKILYGGKTKTNTKKRKKINIQQESSSEEEE
ncbi:hypothetical protein FQA39_LY09555 [Lamprigera yunnana]|nr:hypothetical protein FQA39_LY09555 [Lamprigera yunnana]